MRVSVVMVNLDGDPFIYQALESLQAQSFKDFEVIVVDNGSGDGSPEKIRGRFPRFKIIELGGNKGFAYACIKGWKESQGEEIAVLNNDAIADPDWLREMVAGLDSDPRIGMVAGKVINKKSGKIESGGIYPARNGLVYLFKPEKENEPAEVFGACGVAGLYRGKMLRELGFYPEDFFIYYEDADLAYRAQRAGWKAIYCPGASVNHLGSETTVGLGIKDYYLPRNRLRTIARNWDPGLILKFLPWILLYEWASFFGAVLSGKTGSFKARWDFFRFLRADLKARKADFSRTAPGFKPEQWISRKYPGLVELWSARR